MFNVYSIYLQVDMGLSVGTPFPCFHHHLIYMLEHTWCKPERTVFNSLASMSSVLNFLEENLDISWWCMILGEINVIKMLYDFSFLFDESNYIYRHANHYENTYRRYEFLQKIRKYATSVHVTKHFRFKIRIFWLCFRPFWYQFSIVKTSFSAVKWSLSTL